MKKIVLNKIVLLTVSLILIGVVGVFVWKYFDRKNTNTATVTSSTTTTQNVVTGTDAPFALQPGWKTVQVYNKTLSIQIPTNWFSYTAMKEGNATTLSNLDVSPTYYQKNSALAQFSTIEIYAGYATLPQGEDLYTWHQKTYPQLYDNTISKQPVEHLSLANKKTVLWHSNNDVDVYYTNNTSAVDMISVHCPNPDLCAVSKQILGTVQFN